MKKFFNNIFKPLIFPIITLFIGAYINTGENLEKISSFFLDSSNRLIGFFSNQLYLWEIILYLIIIYALIRAYRLIFQTKSKKEKRMIQATKEISHEHTAVMGENAERYKFRFEPKVINERYVIQNMRVYCINCSETPLKMSRHAVLYYKCGSCERQIHEQLLTDVKNRIISNLEVIEPE
jgi:hypothetical protein